MKWFAVWEDSKGKCRAIDNGRPSGHNDAADLSERIHTTSTDMGLAVARRLLGHQVGVEPPRVVHRNTRDMKHGFRQISRADIHSRYHIAAACHPRLNIWVFAELVGLAFGIGVAVNYCNRVPQDTINGALVVGILQPHVD